MADVIDDAQAVNELHQEISLNAARAKNAPEQHPDFNGRDCIDCDEEIPAPRLLLGKVRCVDCQSELEHRQRMHPRTPDREGDTGMAPLSVLRSRVR